MEGAAKALELFFTMVYGAFFFHTLGGGIAVIVA